MKKGLSVLLIAAALFGFYGGAVNLNDVLACKDYWEEAGEKSTADMNKLEDGLNQLKENEQAYLDGVEQVAEGEQTLADGEAQYAQGLADYAAAPGQLAAASKKIAKGEEDLAEGKKSLNGLTTLINYLSDVQSKYSKWKVKYQNLVTARKTMAEQVAPAYSELVKMADSYMKDTDEAATQTAFKGAVGGLAYNKTNAKADTTADSVTLLNYAIAVSGGIDTVQSTISSGIDNAKTLKAGATKAKAGGSGYFIQFVKTYSAGLSAMTNYVYAAKGQETATAYGTAIAKITAEGYNPDAEDSGYSGYEDDIINGLSYAQGALEKAYAGVTTDNIKNAKAAMDSFAKTYNSGYDSSKGRYTSSIIENEIAGADGGQGYIATVCKGVAQTVLGNKTLKSAVQSNMGSDGIALLTALAKTEMLFPYVEGTYDSGVEFSTFIYEMETNPNILTALAKAKALLVSARASGQKTYNAGVAKLKAGKKQYAAGLANYKAAPAKLASAEQQLADGRQALADGKAQLAQYEDGEQQVRDGLATLVGTEADLDLESIKDRLNGDTDFDNGDDHLDIDEGLNAVEVGRGYKADDGELITAEIMARAVGTAGILGAGILAIIAAILSFMKKNKGAGVFAILAAAAGAFGAFYGTNAGTYFSEIAGSTAGNAGWVAAGILGAIALVHAIVHFTAKPEA